MTTEARGGRAATLESDVAVPGAQAAMLGVAVGLGAGVIVLLLGGPVFGLRGADLWSWSGRIAGVVCVGTLAASLVLLVVDQRKLLWWAESVTGADLDRDGSTGKPPRTTIQVTDPTKRHMRLVDLPLSDDRLTNVAREVLANGAAFSRRGLAGVLSQHEYEQLSKAMLKGGLLVEMPDRTRELSGSGRALFRKLV